MDFPVSKAILLTGAGFTHNFGGLLAEDVWVEIHNHVHRSGQDRLIRLIKNNFDYEYLYLKIVYSEDYTSLEKSVFINAVLQAYETLEGTVCDYKKRFINTTPIDLNGVNDLISLFVGPKKEKGFFFTLNQDTFIERYFSSSVKLVYPGLKVNCTRFNIGRDKRLEEQDFVKVPTEEELQRQKDELKSLGDIYYIKLHGSYDWRDTSDQKKLIMGGAKLEQIREEPILSWYIDLFKEVLLLPNRRLLIIGYGFRDHHINEILANSIANGGLKIFIISPIHPRTFKEEVLCNALARQEIIWNGIGGYYPYPLSIIFPYGVSSTQHYKNLQSDLFGH